MSFLLIMKLFFLLVVISGTFRKVIAQHEEIHVSNEISKDPVNPTSIASETKETTLAPTSKEISKKEIDHDTDNVIVQNETETTRLIVDNGTALILTPFIKDGRIAEARNASRVNPELFLGFESYSGFVTVNETLNSNLFFWYFPVADKPVSETPWIVWLDGGPGVSSLSGQFNSIGPINIISNGTLRRNPHTWLVNHSLLFIDNPVGSGYSFTDSKDGFTKDLHTYGSHLHIAMKQIVQIFPELQKAPLFIAGESYAGKYVPALAIRIHRQRDWLGGQFNLQGLMMGNALIDPEVISHIGDSFQYFGIMDQTQLDYFQPLIDGFQHDIVNNRSVEAKNKWVTIIWGLIHFSFLEHAYNFLNDDKLTENSEYSTYLARSDVKRALHVGDIQYYVLNVTVNMELAPDFLTNTKPLMEELLEHYRVLVYCGQLDLMLPCLHLSKNYRTWTWNGTQQFLQAVRSPYYFDDRTAGYHKTGGRLTEVVFRGAGHSASKDVPAPAQALVARWTHGQNVSAQPPYPQFNILQEFQVYIDDLMNQTINS